MNTTLTPETSGDPQIITEEIPTCADSISIEAGIIPASSPRSLSTGQLVEIVVGTFQRIQDSIPYIIELHKRFKAAPRSKANINGCDTWEQFCETHLHRTASAIRKALQLEINNGKAYPKYEYIENFITAEDGANLIQKFEESNGWVAKETGSCTIPPSHATIHWGPRQAYLDCVPTEYRAKSAGDIPDFLVPLQTRLEKKYNCVFNSAQINKHFDHDAVVHAHTDSNAGHICMISIGAERDFVLKSFAHGRKEFARLKQGSGSLLTFFPKEQHKHTHEMPKSTEPCGVRYSIIFRHIQPVLTIAGNLTKKVKGTWEEKKAIGTQRESEYRAGQKREPMPPLPKDAPMVLPTTLIDDDATAAPPQPPAPKEKTSRPYTLPAKADVNIGDLTATLTTLFQEFSKLNAIKDAEPQEVQTLIRLLDDIAREAAKKSAKLRSLPADVPNFDELDGISLLGIGG
jgi:alkylated DNA repair dioxygenase AlkB